MGKLNVNIFEAASRRGLRFASGRGEATVDQLWTMNLESLDALYQGYKKEQSASTESASLLPSATARKSKNSVDLDLRIEILKHIVTVRLEEAEVTKAATERRQRIQQLKVILANKAEEALQGTSSEDLTKMIQELEEQDRAAFVAV